MKEESYDLAMELGENKDYLQDFLNRDEAIGDLVKIQKIVRRFAIDLENFSKQANGNQKNAKIAEQYSELLNRALDKMDLLQKQKEDGGGNELVIIRRNKL